MISSPNVTPVPLGRKQQKKYKRKRNTIYKRKRNTILRYYHKEQVYSDRKHYHLNYNNHTNNVTSLHLFGIKEKGNISKSGIKRTEWKTMTLSVFGIGIWNLRNPKPKKLTIPKMEPFLMFNRSQLLSYHFFDLPLFFVHTFWIFLKTSKLLMGREK